MGLAVLVDLEVLIDLMNKEDQEIQVVLDLADLVAQVDPVVQVILINLTIKMKLNLIYLIKKIIKINM